jgi:hypothetical protein
MKQIKIKTIGKVYYIDIIDDAHNKIVHLRKPRAGVIVGTTWQDVNEANILSGIIPWAIGHIHRDDQSSIIISIHFNYELQKQFMKERL